MPIWAKSAYRTSLKCTAAGEGDHLKRLAGKEITMKTEMLKELGLSQEQIDKIMAENGKDIAAEQAKITAKDGELAKANETIKGLQDTVKKFDGVDPDKLKQDLADLQKKYDADISQTKLDSALELALVQSKARNTKAVRALLKAESIKLDGDKLLGLDEQLTALKKEASYLFEDEEKKQETTITASGGEHNEATKTAPDTLNGALREFYNVK